MLPNVFVEWAERLRDCRAAFNEDEDCRCLDRLMWEDCGAFAGGLTIVPLRPSALVCGLRSNGVQWNSASCCALLLVMFGSVADIVVWQENKPAFDLDNSRLLFEAARGFRVGLLLSFLSFDRIFRFYFVSLRRPEKFETCLHFTDCHVSLTSINCNFKIYNVIWPHLIRLGQCHIVTVNDLTWKRWPKSLTFLLPLINVN